MLNTHLTTSARLRVDVHVRAGSASSLPVDAKRGLTESPKHLPPKHFYDARGSRLFDAICETPEYYPTRTEQALLTSVADQLMRCHQPTHLVELGSGMARKTRALLEAGWRAAKQAQRPAPCYVPFDVSESALRSSAAALLKSYPWLSVHGVVGDFDRHLDKIPRGNRRLIAFLGGTIGNFEHADAVAFLTRISRGMRPGDALLLGTDLVKPKPILDRAYNDCAGLTAEFNLNLLDVMNRELDADFQVDQFRHVAFYSEERQRIEMHLESLSRQQVRLKQLDLLVSFEPGERMLTEVSRKFTQAGVAELLSAANLERVSWFVPDNQYFALSVARVRS